MRERVAFGLELRRARERRGLTLEEISGQTKVSAAHFAALECGDVSRWPSGIFRRAFIRGYAAAVGLDPDETVARFGRFFPDPVDDPRAAQRAASATRASASAPADLVVVPPAEAPALRLVLDHAGPATSMTPLGAGWRRVIPGGIDVSLALAPAALAAVVLGRDWFWFAAACVGLVGHLAFFGIVGATPGSWLVARRRVIRPATPAAQPVRSRQDPDVASGGRRRALRLAASTPPAHAHRVRH